MKPKKHESEVAKKCQEYRERASASDLLVPVIVLKGQPGTSAKSAGPRNPHLHMLRPQAPQEPPPAHLVEANKSTEQDIECVHM